MNDITVKISIKTLCVLIALVCFPHFVIAANTTRQKPVVIALNDWASQRVLSRVVGQLFNELSVPVKYQEITVKDQWGGFRLGVVDVQVELWQGSNVGQFNNSVRKGFIVDAGSHDATAREEWWYPAYVKPLCPGLPNWRALLSCPDVFASETSADRGVYYSGQWNEFEGIRIRALNLQFNIVRLDNDAALWRKLDTAIKHRRPIIMLNWTPNWTDARVKGEFVEFPPYHNDCVNNASWGINKAMTMDCANPTAGWVKKISSQRVKDNYPCVHLTLTRVNFTTQMIAEAAALVINDKMSETEAAIKWINQYKPQWLYWLPQGCMPQ